jgi:uncharacterized protein (DUF305 family)
MAFRPGDKTQSVFPDYGERPPTSGGRRPMPCPRSVCAALSLLVALGLSACSGEEQASGPRPEPSLSFTADSPVEVPGAPGEPHAVIPPGGTGTIENPNAHVDADVAFVRDMAAHHAQALEMASLAPERAQDERVKALADRIAAGQQPEIAVMQAWLRDKGLPEVDLTAGHRHGMPGMASEQDLFSLRESTGRDFDRRFLQLMTAHHEGALAMAEAASEARNIVVLELLQDISITQSVEIARMAEVAADLA